MNLKEILINKFNLLDLTIAHCGDKEKIIINKNEYSLVITDKDINEKYHITIKSNNDYKNILFSGDLFIDDNYSLEKKIEILNKIISLFDNIIEKK